MGLRSSLKRFTRKAKRFVKRGVKVSLSIADPLVFNKKFRDKVKTAADRYIAKYGGALSIGAMFIPVVGWLVSGLIDRRQVELMLKEYEKLSDIELVKIRKMTSEQARKYLDGKVTSTENTAAGLRFKKRENLNIARLDIINTGIQKRTTKMMLGFFFRSSQQSLYIN